MTDNGSHQTPRVAVASFSGFGHTARLGDAVALGAAGAQTDVDANPDDVHPADVATCRHLGCRVRQFCVGRTLLAATTEV